MDRVCIGIHVHSEPHRFQATLESLRDTAPQADLLILADGPEAELRSAFDGLKCSATPEPQGAPACFNRLAALSDADVLILLESGCIAADGWLEALLEALQADPRNGLAGPSTNLCWNEQGVFRGASGSPAEVARCAAEARKRFAGQWRRLEPLHSLADFCYAVRRETVEAVGGADEAYGLGPCWEMDYNIRAARAGFRGVWAGAAYVCRPPFTRRRRREEARRFESAKRLYQDKFCALRLRGLQEGYEPHCRGEECEHFAPKELIQIRLPLRTGSSGRGLGAGGRSPDLQIPASGSDPLPKPRPPATSPLPSSPLISCIMPTAGRAEYVLQSVRYFQHQDYPNRELIIVDDRTPGLRERLPDDPSIRYLSLPAGQSIGAKRNRACREARGDIIAHWDDDDWYGPARLSLQTGPLLSGAAEISALRGTIFFDLQNWEFWECSQDLHRRLFVHDAHGGTLVFKRRVWQELVRYPNSSLAEDAFFLRQAVRRGARLKLLPSRGHFLYLRHGSNSWAFTSGQHVDPSGWRRLTAEPAIPRQDRDFYLQRSGASPPPTGDSPQLNSSLSLRASASLREPLASCIMPTADRRRFLPQAIGSFLRQDYPCKELIIVDDGQDPVGDLVPSDPSIRYLRLNSKRSLGEKRNLACRHARGEIILHWDDDDWQADWRIRYQIEALLEGDADLCGIDRVYFYDPQRRQAWEYSYPGGKSAWVYGGALGYRKSFWQRHPFTALNVGEDNAFVARAQPGRVVRLKHRDFYVGRIHGANTSPKRTSSRCWRRLSDAPFLELVQSL